MTYAKVINGRLKEATELKPVDMTGWDEVNIPPINLRYEDGEYKYVEYIAPTVAEEIVNQVPQQVSPRQARLALLQATLLDDVELLLANDKAMQIWWEYSLDIQRNNEHIITMGTALGMTEVQLDDLFILAGSL